MQWERRAAMEASDWKGWSAVRISRAGRRGRDGGRPGSAKVGGNRTKQTAGQLPWCGVLKRTCQWRKRGKKGPPRHHCCLLTVPIKPHP